MQPSSFQMSNFASLAITLLCVFRCEAQNTSGITECGMTRGSTRTLNLYLLSKTSRSGLWTTNFIASKEDSGVKEPSNITMDFSQSVTECNGKRRVVIAGVLAAADVSSMATESIGDMLHFHINCGANAAITNNGFTIHKIKLDEDGNSVGFSNRPLRDNEIFEAKLTKKHSKFSYSLAIGVTTISPDQLSVPQHINSMKPSWAMYHRGLYRNGSEWLKIYGQELNSLSVGDRVGVMRSNTGSLHFFVNGVDQGPAASNMPQSLYGLIELWGNAAMADIVKSS